MRGRKPKPIDPGAPPAAARFGRTLRERRVERGVTQTVLGELAGCTAQHISGLERTKAHPTKPCVAALDAALEADGALLALVDAVVCERARANTDRHAARQLEVQALAALRFALQRDAGDDDVDPTTRLELIEAGAATALGVPVLGAVPARAGEVDPELPEHLADLLRLLGRHDEIFGPHGVLAVVETELRMIAEHREAARGELRVALMRVEARWAELAAWLRQDTGDAHGRDRWIERALRLAQEAGYADMVAFARARQSEWASDGHRAAALAEDALRVPDASAQTRAWCSRQAALGYAMAGRASGCERRLADAYGLLDAESHAPPWAGEYRVGRAGTRATEARCWAALDPAKAITLYDDALRDWPRAEARDGGLHRARLASACANTGELDRARAEASHALAIYRQTQSASVARELRQLGTVLKAA